jgi:hypothetical protein
MRIVAAMTLALALLLTGPACSGCSRDDGSSSAGAVRMASTSTAAAVEAPSSSTSAGRVKAPSALNSATTHGVTAISRSVPLTGTPSASASPGVQLSPDSAAENVTNPAGGLLANRNATLPPASSNRSRFTVASAQGPGTVPGGVATVILTVKAPPGVLTGSVSYTLETAPGYRLFAAPTGTLPLDSGRVLLPVTVGVPVTEQAGPSRAGTATLAWPDGGTTEVTFRIMVRAVRKLELGLSPADALVSPGETTELSFWIRNRGNAPDTARLKSLVSSGWGLAGLPDTLIIVAGDTARGTLHVRAPEDANRGQEQTVVLNVQGAGKALRATSTVMVTSEAGWLSGYAHVPGTVFVGGSLGDGNMPGISLRGEGNVAPGTQFSLELRHAERYQTPPAFRTQLTGPELRVSVKRPDLQATAGEVFIPGNVSTGPVLSGRGVNGTYNLERWRFGLFAARPGTFASSRNGHQIQAFAGIATGHGPVRMTVTDLRQNDVFGPAYRAQGVSFRYDLPSGSDQDLSVEAGWLRVAPDSGETATGPTLVARYAFDGPAAHFNAAARLVPGTVPQNSSVANELFATGTVDVAPNLAVVGWGQIRSTPILNTPNDPQYQAASLGFRSGFADATVQMGAAFRRASAGILGTTTRQTVRLNVKAPVWALNLEGDAEIGTFTRAGDSAPYNRLWGGAYWYAGATWLRAGVTYNHNEYGNPYTTLEASGSWTGSRVSVQGGILGRLNNPVPGGSTSLWTSAHIRALPDATVVVGADYEPGFNGSRWRLSLGVSHRLGLPLPVRRQPALQGIVYEDRNGNRIHDADEPTLRGVRIRVGRLQATTDADGAFQFRDTFRGPVTVDPATLPPGMVMPIDVHLPIAGTVDVPVVHTASLELDLFIDLNNDGTRDPAEQPAAGTVVSLMNVSGASRDAVTDEDGHARFGAVSPGTYTVRIYRTANGGQAGTPVQVKITLLPGAHVSTTIAVPAHTRQIRMGAGANLGHKSNPH